MKNKLNNKRFKQLSSREINKWFIVKSGVKIPITSDTKISATFAEGLNINVNGTRVLSKGE